MGIINALYSILFALYFFAGTYLAGYIGFRWGRLYYFVILLIFIMVIFKKMNRVRLQDTLKDKYLLLMILIFSWGILSSLFSIQTTLSIKMTISVLLVFLVSYLIPRHFFTAEDQQTLMTCLLVPLNIIMTLIGILNLLDFLKLIELNKYIVYWTSNASIFSNSNTFGVRIMLILILMNVYLIVNEGYKNALKENKILKVYMFFSYMILIVNMVFSGGRSSVLGTIVVFLPILYKYRKMVLVGIIPIGYLIWIKRASLLLLKKMPRGTSGRSEIWEHVITEVIPKHPILGAGKGAFQDNIGNTFEVNHMHNSYLNVIMSDGFVGLALWLIILFILFKSIFNLKKNRYIFMFTILGFMAYSFFEIGLFGELGLKNAVFWTVVMFIEATDKRNEGI